VQKTYKGARSLLAPTTKINKTDDSEKRHRLNHNEQHEATAAHKHQPGQREGQLSTIATTIHNVLNNKIHQTDPHRKIKTQGTTTTEGHQQDNGTRHHFVQQVEKKPKMRHKVHQTKIRTIDENPTNDHPTRKPTTAPGRKQSDKGNRINDI
jgi:hypothetical protein